MRENQFGICSHVEINLNIHTFFFYFSSGYRQHSDGEERKMWANKFMYINSIAVLDKNEFCLRTVCVCEFPFWDLVHTILPHRWYKVLPCIHTHSHTLWHRQISTSSQTMNVIIALTVMFTQQELGVNYCHLWNLFVKIASNNL